MKKKIHFEREIKNIHDILDRLEPADRNLLTDKIIYELFFKGNEEKSGKVKSIAGKKNNLNNLTLSKEEIKLIKKLSADLESLKNLLGDNPSLFL
ncbi:MAG: hypothetical protein ACHQNT_06725 [Bacteroidia bacterium]